MILYSESTPLSTNFKQICCSTMSHLDAEIAISFIHLVIFLVVFVCVCHRVRCMCGLATQRFFQFSIPFGYESFEARLRVCVSVNDHSKHTFRGF